MPAASSLTVWILGAAFLAGGFAAGYVAGQGNDALPDDAPPLERAATPRAADSPVLTLERPAAPPTGEAHLDSTRAAELAPLRELLDTLPPLEIPRGTGVIHGSVKTPDGKGVAGVEVTLHPQQPEAGSWWSDDGDLTVVARRAIDAVRWRRQARQRTTTADDGTYRFDAVADLVHSLEPKLEGWQIRPTGPRRAWQVRPDAELDFVAQAVARVPITIVLPDGTTPDTASIRMTQGGRPSGAGWSRQTPSVEMQPGTWEVTVTAGTAGEFKADPQTLTVEQGAAPTPLRFELESRGAIHGRVQYAPGETLPQGRVYLVRIPKGQKPDPARLASSELNTHLQSWRGAGPTFTFSDLGPGRYLLGLSRGWQGAIAVTQEVEVGDEAVEVVVQVPPLGREEYVEVRLLGPDGETLKDAHLIAGRNGKNGSRSSSAHVIDREDGSKWMLHDAVDADAETTYWVQASHALYGTVREEYRRTRASAVELRFARPGTLEVTVTGLAGTRYDGRLRASASCRGAGARVAGKLDAGGHVTLSGLQPGAYRVILTLGGDRGRQSQIHAEKLEIAAGSNQVRIAMPPLYEVEILGAEGRISLRSSGGGGTRVARSLAAAADGRATVDGLPAGAYRVRSGPKQAEFTVPGATTVRLE